MEFWVLTRTDPEPARPRYFALEQDAKDEIERECEQMQGEWVERELEQGAVEWAFYELDGRGELLQVLVWTLACEELMLVVP